MNPRCKIKEVPAEYSEDFPIKAGLRDSQCLFRLRLCTLPATHGHGRRHRPIRRRQPGICRTSGQVWRARIMDTGIREATIVGQAIGLALRGFRPIADIQYLDYLLYAIETLSDDLASLRWRTCGGQKAPVIIRTRGHRLEGIWHSGSPMAGIINLIRGIYICVPRDATQAAGFYNTICNLMTARSWSRC